MATKKKLVKSIVASKSAADVDAAKLGDILLRLDSIDDVLDDLVDQFESISNDFQYQLEGRIEIVSKLKEIQSSLDHIGFMHEFYRAYMSQPKWIYPPSFPSPHEIWCQSPKSSISGKSVSTSDFGPYGSQEGK